MIMLKLYFKHTMTSGPSGVILKELKFSTWGKFAQCFNHSKPKILQLSLRLVFFIPLEHAFLPKRFVVFTLANTIFASIIKHSSHFHCFYYYYFFVINFCPKIKSIKKLYSLDPSFDIIICIYRPNMIIIFLKCMIYTFLIVLIDKTLEKNLNIPSTNLHKKWNLVITFPNGLDSTSVTNILKNTTTLLNFRNMFRCFKHHLQPQ